jgi:hypothetical protein
MQHLNKVVKDINVLLGYIEDFQQWQEGERLKDPLLHFPRPQPNSQLNAREKSPEPHRNSSSESDRESRDERAPMALRSSTLGRSVTPSTPQTPLMSPSLERKRKRLSGELFRGQYVSFPSVEPDTPGSDSLRLFTALGSGAAMLGDTPVPPPPNPGVAGMDMGETMTQTPQAPSELRAEAEPLEPFQKRPPAPNRVVAGARCRDVSNRFTCGLEDVAGRLSLSSDREGVVDPATFSMTPDEFCSAATQSALLRQGKYALRGDVETRCIAVEVPDGGMFHMDVVTSNV